MLSKRLSKLFFVLIIFVSFTLVFFVGINNNDIKTAKAESSEFIEVSLQNKNFDSSSSYSLQTNPTGWNKINDNPNIKSGIINVSTDNYPNYITSYGLDGITNPETSGTNDSDKYVLMINALNQSVKTGFKTSDSISLNENSFYIISVNVKTTDSSFASIYLDGIFDQYDNTNSFEEIESLQWSKNTFFIATGSEKQTVNISLYLGSKKLDSTGVVFFDNIELYQTSETLFYQIKEQIPSSLSRSVILKSQEIDITQQIANANFDNPAIQTLTPIREGNVSFVDVSSNNKYNNLSNNNKFAFSIANQDKTYTGYKLDNIKIPTYGVYQLSVDVKVIQSLNGKALLRLVEDDFVKEYYSSYEPKTVELSISSNSTNQTKNDFNTYNFYIYANGLLDTTVSLEIWLGTEDENAKGEIAIDSIQFKSITSSLFDSITASSTTQIVSLSTSSADAVITNGNFNKYKINSPIEFDTLNNPIYKFPLTPANWTFSSNNLQSTNIKYGIININEDLFDESLNIINPSNPIITTEQPGYINSNNILMMNNKISDAQSLTSDVFNLEANSTYEISITCKTNMIIGGLNIILTCNDKNVSRFTTIDTGSEWKTYRFVVKTLSATTASIKLELGSDKTLSQGTAFVDNVRATTKTYTAENFDALYSQNYTKVIDFVNGKWAIISDTPNSFDIYELLTASTNLADNAFAGVINGSSNAFNVVSSKTGRNNQMLVISNSSIGTSSIITSKEFSFEEGKYYKISLDILTQRITALENSDQAFGVSLKLTNLDKTFNNIVSDEHFSTYIFYVKSKEAIETGLELTLSSPNASTTGNAIFDNLKVEELIQSEYDEFKVQQDSNTLAQNALVVATSYEEETENTDTESSNDQSLTNREIWLLVPTIIFGLAVIIAIVVFCFGKIKFKKIDKIKQSSYDRLSTLEKEKAKIEAKKSIEAKIKEQNDLLEYYNNQIKELDEKYQNELKEFRNNKTNANSNKMEKEFKNYVNNKSKLESSINSIKDKIASLENPELLIIEEKKFLNKYSRERKSVNKQIKKESKKQSKK